MIHPRDLYDNLEAIWMSFYSYLAKRFPLEQVMLDYSIEELENTASYLKHEIPKRQEQLTNMKAIHSILVEVLEDTSLNNSTEKIEY